MDHRRVDGGGFAFAERLPETHDLEARATDKALFNARLIDGVYVFAGDQVAIEAQEVSYEPLCASCYLEESGGMLA